MDVSWYGLRPAIEVTQLELIPQENVYSFICSPCTGMQVTLLFEVEDLAVASPATVSRSGMVYNDWKDLGWKPYVQSWLSKRKDKVTIDINLTLAFKHWQRTQLITCIVWHCPDTTQIKYCRFYCRY